MVRLSPVCGLFSRGVCSSLFFPLKGKGMPTVGMYMCTYMYSELEFTPDLCVRRQQTFLNTQHFDLKML